LNPNIRLQGQASPGERPETLSPLPENRAFSCKRGPDSGAAADHWVCPLLKPGTGAKPDRIFPPPRKHRPNLSAPVCHREQASVPPAVRPPPHRTANPPPARAPTENGPVHGPGEPLLIAAKYPRLPVGERPAYRYWRFRSGRRLTSDRPPGPAGIRVPPRQTGFVFPAGNQQKDEARNLWAEGVQHDDMRLAPPPICLLPEHVPEKARRVQIGRAHV